MRHKSHTTVILKRLFCNIIGIVRGSIRSIESKLHYKSHTTVILKRLFCNIIGIVRGSIRSIESKLHYVILRLNARMLTILVVVVLN